MTNKYFPTNLPNFLEIQRSSFYWFLIYGLSDQLSLFPSIIDLNTEIEVRFYVNEFVFKKKRAKTLLDYKQNNLTYGIKIFLPIYIKNPNTNERKRKQNIFIGQLPLMTNNGSFIINGCERVVVSQIIKCPGLYYKIQIIKNQVVSTITLASQRGSWLQFEFNDSGCWVRVDKNQKVCILDFLYGIGLNDQEIMFGLKSEYILYKYKNYQEQLKSSDERDQFLPDEDLEFICSRLFNIKYYELGKVGRLRLNKRLNLNIATNVKTITHQDILAILDYFLTLKSFLSDDFDDLRNKSIRSVGEILENQFRIGLNRFKRNIAETITIYQEFDLTISNLINPRPLIASIKEFFGTSQLSQYLDQTNPLAELSHKRRISALGPGGLNIDRITLAARDIHPTQYGRICPIETPEGKNVGLVGGLASYAKVNSNGFIETPYFQVKHGQILYNKPLVYLSANEEENVKIAAADVKRNKKGFLTDEFIVARFNQEFIMASTKDIDFVSISPLQITSIAASLIPFLEHDDGNRALMGANMQRQAVPLLYPQKPIVGTGLELKIVADSLFVVLAVKSGIVKFVSSEKIIIKNFEGTEISYLLKKYQRSNQNTCINQKP